VSGEITFHGGRRTLAGFGVAVAAIVAVFVPVEAAVADLPTWVGVVADVARFAAFAGALLAVLRFEEVGLPELGLSRGRLLPALAAFGAVWVALNALGVAVATAAGEPWSVASIWTLPERGQQLYGSLRAPWLTAVLLQFAVVGLVEEAAFRGYFQTKVIALLGDGGRLRVAGGVAASSLLFGVLHTPGALFAGASPTGVLAAAALPAITGVLFGAIYELTHNVWLVALFHGLGNTWPLAVDWTQWSGPTLWAFWAGAAVVYVAAVAGYRRWAVDTDRSPLVRRVNDARPSAGAR